MADRFWVGGDGTWDVSNTSNWSSTSGGSSGAAVPTIGDVVYFENNSSSGDSLVVTISGSVYCSNIVLNRTSPKTTTIIGDSSSAINAHGTSFYTGPSGVTNLSSFNGWFNVLGNNSVFTGYSVFNKINVGVAVDTALQFSTTNTISEIKLESDSTVTIRNTATVSKIEGTTSVPSGGPYPVTPTVHIAYSSNPTANLYVTGDTNCLNGAINLVSNYTGSLYIEPSTGNCSMNLGVFYSGGALGASIQEIVFKPLSSGDVFTISGFAFISDIVRYPASPSFRLKVVPSTNIGGGLYLSDINVDGDISTTVYIESSIIGTRASLIALGGLKETNYVEVKDMQPSPDNTWISYNSTNAGNNYQWYFDDFEKPTSNLFFGSHL